MASDPRKVRQHQERTRVLALSHLFDPDPEQPDKVSLSAFTLPLPEGLTFRGGAARELKEFLASPFADVRRLAASALGKMASEKPVADFLPTLVELAADDPHPQVRQYAAKAVARYPKEAFFHLDRMKDVARDETAPGYVRTAAAEAVAAIQKENRSRIAREYHWCTRCRRQIEEEQYLSTMERWGRAYCRHCNDEKELENRDFESLVDAAKAKRTTGGTAVQSRGEKRIAEFLESEGIAYEYDERYRISGADTIRPDFYLPEFDVYIEYYGMNTPEYNANRRRKHVLYQRAAKKLISLSYEDDAQLVDVLRRKLSRYVGGLS